jgi:hypothetical protein
MLVRELMEQLADMPPELPVGVSFWPGEWAPIVGAVKGGRLDGPIARVYVDSEIYNEQLREHVLEAVASAL